VKNELFLCECGCSEHLIVVRYDDEIDQWHQGDTYFNYHLRSDTFRDRLKNAFWHIMGRKSVYGDFGEHILEPSDENIKSLKRIVKHLEKVKKHRDKLATEQATQETDSQ
jgi:hypothetical protein